MAAMIRSVATGPILDEATRTFIAVARRAVLATIDPAGRPRLVPICVVLEPDAAILWTPLDEKPKSTRDPMALARVRDIARRPDVSVLVDRWDEDWSRLAWVRIHGDAVLIGPGEPGHAMAVAALRARYPQYATHGLERRPMIRIDITAVTSWGGLGS
jgi:PPOX class probable F420-dependent enzyme